MLNEHQFFHGTGAWLKPGDTVRPTDSLFTTEPQAYASSSFDHAAGYSARHAQGRASDIEGRPSQMSLFRPVYQVEPTTDRADVLTMPVIGQSRLRDPGGLKVKGTAGYGTWSGGQA